MNGSFQLLAEASSYGLTIFTQYDVFSCENILSKQESVVAFKACSEIVQDIGDEQEHLEIITLLLGDVPHQHLLKFTPDKKAGALGLISLAYLLHHTKEKDSVFELASSGRGVVLFKIFVLDGLMKYNIKLFFSQKDYAQFVGQALAAGEYVSSKSSGFS